MELFTDYGSYPCDGVDCSLEGSALRVLKSGTKFTRYGFLSQSRKAAKSLAPLIAPYNADNNVEILCGNPNSEKDLRHLLDNVPRSASSLILIDPGGYCRLYWSTLEKISHLGKNWQGEKMDLLIIFPLEMALMRNLMRPECSESITRFYGNQQWEEIKRRKQIEKKPSEDIKYRLVELFKNGLSNLGYRYVEDFKPASPTRNPYYHIIYASDRISRLKNIKEAWGKSRFLRCELLYGIKTTKRK